MTKIWKPFIKTKDFFIFISKLMRILVNENIFEELQIYKKGNMQSVYTSDNLSHLVKRPKYGFFTDRELQLYELMAKHPKYFAKIFKIEPDEVWQERLDEKKFVADLHDVYLEFQQQDYFDWIPKDFYKNDSEWRDAMIYAVLRDSNGEHFKKCMVNLSKTSFDFLKKLINTTKAINALEKSVGLEFDVHSEQFGYDKSGDIKMFDI